jgi:hypothetical protein
MENKQKISNISGLELNNLLNSKIIEFIKDSGQKPDNKDIEYLITRILYFLHSNNYSDKLTISDINRIFENLSLSQIKKITVIEFKNEVNNFIKNNIKIEFKENQVPEFTNVEYRLFAQVGLTRLKLASKLFCEKPLIKRSTLDKISFDESVKIVREEGVEALESKLLQIDFQSV